MGRTAACTRLHLLAQIQYYFAAAYWLFSGGSDCAGQHSTSNQLITTVTITWFSVYKYIYIYWLDQWRLMQPEGFQKPYSIPSFFFFFFFKKKKKALKLGSQ